MEDGIEPTVCVILSGCSFLGVDMGEEAPAWIGGGQVHKVSPQGTG